MKKTSESRIESAARQEPADCWGALAERLRASPPYRRIRKRLGTMSGLPTAAAAWVVELLARDLGRPVLVVLPHEAQVLEWLEAAELFGGGAVYFPAPSLSPYQETEISLNVRAAEAVALDRLVTGDPRSVVCTLHGLFRKLPEAVALQDRVLELAAGEEVPPDRLARALSARGYRPADLVTEVGEFASRGGVFDLYAPGEAGPVRLDLFGDTVESLRRFDPETQRSGEAVERLRILPLAPFPVGPEPARALADRLERTAGVVTGAAAAAAVASLRERGEAPGWQRYLPWLAEGTTCLTGLARDRLLVVVDPPTLREETARHAERLEADYEGQAAAGRLSVPPDRLEETAEAVEAVLAAAPLAVSGLAADGGVVADFGAVSTDLFHGQLPRFPRELETARARGERLLMVTPPEHFGRFEELARTYELPLGPGGLELVPGELRRGFRLPAIGAVLYGEAQIFPRATAGRSARRGRQIFRTGLRDLRPGDHLVHADHGIGRFVGLRTVPGETDGAAALPRVVRDAAPAASGDTEVMEIEYAGGRRLLLPLSRLDLVEKYSGLEGVAPRLDRLGGSSWSRKKERVRAGMRQLAGELLSLYAARRLAEAPAMPPDSDLQAQFEAAFEYEETPDQIEAIAAIKEDLSRPQPMDRLLCGDVGFGKTEVAMRAAFKVVEAGYQVAVLAPTTILADQHLETFRRRFAGFPVRVEMLSRLRTPAEIREVRRGLESGKVDILIGTHRLLSRDVVIPRLALLVVDEEQRFGVAQKERLKRLKKEVHALAMTATPVPRTLQMSMAGVRDLSVIESPPRDRMAVETTIAPFAPDLIREAIEFELERRGQIYFVFNRVEGIEETARLLRRLVPGLRLTIGHGQMDEVELARRMHAFKRHEYDLLLATTIIENGIDISNVNTMLIQRADRFGLAQLYQLRGRVGRSHQLAYCYLLVPPDRVLAASARKRLEAIREFTELGSGFRIAARDLEIRGAGNLLGPEQSGQIAAVGIETYLRMLEETVRELQGETVEPVVSTALDLPGTATIPESYIGDPSVRMEVYRRIAGGETVPSELMAELRDRFGPPPPAVGRLVELGNLKKIAESLRVQSISGRRSRLQIRLRRDTRIDVGRLIRLVGGRSGASFSPTGVLTLEAVPPQAMVGAARAVLEELA